MVNDKVAANTSPPISKTASTAEKRHVQARLSTGEKLYTDRLDGVSRLASPVAAPGGRVYFANAGVSHVVQAGPELKILATNRITNSAGNCGASPAIADGKIFVRNFEHLYCIADVKAKK